MKADADLILALSASMRSAISSMRTAISS